MGTGGGALTTFVAFWEWSSVLLGCPPISNELWSEKASPTNTNSVWEVSAVMQAWFPIKISAFLVIKCDKVFFLCLVCFFPQGWPGVCKELVSQPTHLPTPCTVLSSPRRSSSFSSSSSSQLFTAVGSDTQIWLLGISSPLRLFPFPFPLSPLLSLFLPPWSCSSCLSTTNFRL